jgi:hypothetical protein
MYDDTTSDIMRWYWSTVKSSAWEVESIPPLIISGCQCFITRKACHKSHTSCYSAWFECSISIMKPVLIPFLCIKHTSAFIPLGLGRLTAPRHSSNEPNGLAQAPCKVFLSEETNSTWYHILLHHKCFVTQQNSKVKSSSMPSGQMLVG